MRERHPARVVPRHLLGLVLTCLLLVSPHVTNTSELYQAQSNILPGNMKPNHSSRSSTPTSAPTTANLVMECLLPGEYVSDHCWLDDNTMVVVLSHLEKVVKATINWQTQTCTYNYYSDMPRPYRVACSPDGDEVYVVSITGSVWVYDRHTLKAVWEPEAVGGRPYTVAMNRQIVVIGPFLPGPVYVYNRTREYQGLIGISSNKMYYFYIGLSEEGMFMATTGPYADKLVIHDIPHGSTVITGEHGSGNGQFHTPMGMTSVRGYILVCDIRNNRVSVYSENGEFQNTLEFKGTDLSDPLSIAYRPETKCLSVSIDGTPLIKIFSLT